MKAIVYSSKDVGGTNIANFLISNHGFEVTDERFETQSVFRRGDWDLIRTDSEAVYAEQLNDLNYEELIFASRHKAASGNPSLTAHVCGNFGANDLGGKEGKLSLASANTMCNIFRSMVSYDGSHVVSLEVTHHGPYLDIPHCWIELGSCEKQWTDLKAAEFLSDCTIKGIESKDETKTAIGFGGNHYCPKLTEHEGECAFGHIMPKYAQKHLTQSMVEQMIEKTFPKPGVIYLEKKGVAKQSEVRSLLEKTGLEVIVV